MEDSSDGSECVDYMSIYDLTGTPIAHLCGDFIPDEETTPLPLSSIIIYFHSNGRTQGSGFRISYEVYYDQGRCCLCWSRADQGGMGRNGAGWGAMGRDGARWGGMGRDGAEWGGMGRDGAGWGGMGWDGAEWGGMGRDGAG